MKFDTIAGLVTAAQQSARPLWQLIQEADCQESAISAEQSWHTMQKLLAAMRAAVQDYQAEDRSASGLSGGAAALMEQAANQGKTIAGSFIAEIMTTALRMGEANACMKRIVAAPTAGACGVLPAVLLPYATRHQSSDDELLQALYIAAGFGQVIANRASIAGAEGGCQAEIGSASAMAAAALVQLHGGTPPMMAHAFAMAIKNLLGLVCDPVAGLVEVPCVKRNVIGAMNALAAAEMALAGIESRIPADEVLDAMRQVGSALPEALRETGLGGLAATPTGRTIAEQITGS